MSSILRPHANIFNPGPFQVPTGRPAVDWTHPLANSLIGAWVFGPMRGIDITGRAPPLVPEAGAAFDATPEGIGEKSAASAGGLAVLATPPFKTYRAITAYWRGFVIGNSPTFGQLISITYDNVATNPFQLISIDGGASGTTTGPMRFLWNSGGITANMTGGVLIAGEMNSAAFSLTTGGSQFGYINGVQTATNTNTGAPTSTITSMINISTWTSLPARFANATATCAYFWNRALSAQEVAWLHLYPYDFLLPAVSEIAMLQPQPVTTAFRGTLSELGTRTGSRQRQAA